MNEVRKVIRNGKVAVLYSPGFGAGWSTWTDEFEKQLMFLPEVVELVEQKRHGEITKILVAAALGVSVDKAPYLGGAKDLKIEWVPEGCRVRIDEYDGSESVVVEGQDDGWVTA
jgi:hypothetical protein